MSSIRNAVAIVTGGSSGLGEAVVKKLASSGALGDVTSEADVTNALNKAEEVFGQPPRVVVNCAGIAPSIRVVSGKGVVHSLGDFERTMKVNVLGTFNVLRLATERMLKKFPKDSEYQDAQRGVIINTASIAAFDGQVGQAAYSASKGAIAGMCLPIARDLAQHKIRMMTIAPGVFRTPMVKGLSETVQASLGAAVPFPSRLGDPEEFANFVLCVLDNPMLNGSTIRLDGAIRLAPR